MPRLISDELHQALFDALKTRPWIDVHNLTVALLQAPAITPPREASAPEVQDGPPVEGTE